MKKIFALIFFVSLFSFSVSPTYALEEFTATDVNFDRATGNLSFTYSDQDLSNCNDLAMYPSDMQTNSNTLFYAAEGPTGSISCDAISINSHLEEENNASHFSESSAFILQVRSSGSWFQSQPIPNPYFIPTPPVTTINFSLRLTNGGYKSPTTVRLLAQATSGDTIANTYYILDDGPQETYTNPLIITDLGEHTLTYWSVDNSGREESHHTQTFTVSPGYIVTGKVYIDSNQNGIQDEGEAGYPRAILLLSQPNRATANTTGNYSFPNVVAGTHTETLLVPSGYRATTTNPVTLSVNANTTQNFGIVQNTPTVKIEASPSSDNKTIGQPFNVDIKVTSDASHVFNAARATVSVSSNLTVTGIHTPSSNACNFQYTKTPTTDNPSFAGAIFHDSSTGCILYTMTLIPNAEGAGTITFTNGSIKAYSNNAEILNGVMNASFALGNEDTPTPTPLLAFQITNPLQTYKTNFTLTGTKLDTISKIFVNGSDENSTYPTSTSWENPVTLSLGNNNFVLYGKDEENNQTATQAITVDRHTLGDINGDGVIDLVDASLFAIDWDKTANLTYILSNMNDDENVDLTDLSILAKLEQ